MKTISKYSIFLIFLPFLIGSFYFLQAEYQLLNKFTFVIDDVWIHLEFAKNFAHGNGFAFNPGEPIAASTAPLYTILLSILYLFSNNELLNVYFITTLSSLLAIYFSYRILIILTKNRLFSLLTTIIISSNGWLIWNSLSGMEISLASFFLTLGIWSYLKFNPTKPATSYLPTASFSLLCLIRPETYSFLPLYLIFLMISILTKKKNKHPPYLLAINTLIKNIILILIISAPYALFALSTTGSIFPNTYTAKVGDLGFIGQLKNPPYNILTLYEFSTLQISQYWTDFQKALQEIDPVSHFFLYPSVIYFIFQSLHKKKYHLLFIPCILFIFPLMVGLLVPSDRVSWPWNRHMLFLTPLYIVISLITLQEIIKIPHKSIKFAITLLMAIIIGITYKNIYKNTQKFFLDRTRIINHEHLSLAQWIKTNIPSNQILAASDIGIIGFYTENKIIDTEGLINPNINQFKYRRNSPNKDFEIFTYLSQTQPQYLIKFTTTYPSFSPSLFPMIKNYGNLAIYSTPWKYRPLP